VDFRLRCVCCWQLVAYGVPSLNDLTVHAISPRRGNILLLLIPVFSFHNEPAKLFISGLTAWTLLTISYIVAEALFSLAGKPHGSGSKFLCSARLPTA